MTIVDYTPRPLPQSRVSDAVTLVTLLGLLSFAAIGMVLFFALANV
jgi:hypothetical protein